MKRPISVISFLSIALFTALYFQPSIATADEPTSVSVDSSALEQLITAYILEQGIDIVAENVRAAERETGELDKAIRATLGISVKDIKEYGILGGPNSELRRLFEMLGID